MGKEYVMLPPNTVKQLYTGLSCESWRCVWAISAAGRP